MLISACEQSLHLADVVILLRHIALRVAHNNQSVTVGA